MEPASRRSVRRRRQATRIWWSGSGSCPSRVPGSLAMIWRTWASIIARSCSTAGASGGVGSGGGAGSMSSARKSLGRPSPSVAPAARRTCSRRSRSASSPPVSSTSISRKRLTAPGPLSTCTESSTTSATGPRASRTSTPWRRDRSVATGASGAPRAQTATRSTICAGGTSARARPSRERRRPASFASPGSSSSSRALPWGSLSCHRLLRPSTRRRRVTPATASRWSGVSR